MFNLHNVLRRLLTLAIAILAGSAAHADNVPQAQAAQIAQDFLRRHGVTVQTVHPQRAPRRSQATSAAPYYIFNSADESAFVIVSGESQTAPVLAYSLDGTFDPDSVAPGAAFILAQYEEQIEALRNGAKAAKPIIRDFGEGVLRRTPDWNQSYDFWWKYTPVINGQQTHAGCVATAMAIIMRYHEWPEQGMGSRTYTTHTHRKQLSATFQGTDYHLSRLPFGDESSREWTTEKKDWVAKLIYHCGVAAGLDYTPDGTSGTSPEYAMHQYFGYKQGSYIDCDALDNRNRWLNMVYDEIDAGRPLFYRGEERNGANGHQFVCDGYDKNGLLHFNFGWSGYDNGYYNMAAITTSDYNLSYAQGIVVGVEPDYNATPDNRANLFLLFAPDPDSYGITVEGDGKIHPDAYFYIRAYSLCNVTYSKFTGSVAPFICDRDGKRKRKLGEWDGVQLDCGYYYYWANVRAAIPSSYKVEEGDRICLFSSPDGSNEWRLVECLDPERGYISLNDAYDPTLLYCRLIGYNDEPARGIEADVDGALPINKTFTVTAYGLENELTTTLTGSVGVFLCDSEGKPYRHIGHKSIDLRSQYYYSALQISCRIPSTVEVKPTDRLYLFASKSDTPGLNNIVPVPCEIPERAYIAVDPTGIDDVQADGDADTRYYNTQGVQLPGQPTRGGLYIMRSGARSTKVLVK